MAMPLAGLELTYLTLARYTSDWKDVVGRQWTSCTSSSSDRRDFLRDHGEDEWML
jgi:hypothetical protein